MNAEEIGTLAGKVWALLNEKPMTVKQLKPALKMKETEICCAIGWLSRESKLVVEKQGRDMAYSLA